MRQRVSQMAKIDDDCLAELILAAERMLDAANALWLANHPDELPEYERMPLAEAQEHHSAWFVRLNRAIYAAKRHSID